MPKITTAETRIAAMRKYRMELEAMTPEAAKKEAQRALLSSGVLNENGELNPCIFKRSKYVTN